MSPEREYENTCRNALREIGESEAVNRFLSKYGNWRTKAIYACEIKLYLRNLKTDLKVDLTADQLVKDNLECIFNSDATDVRAKRKHTDWLSEYVNEYLIRRGTSDAHRELAASVAALLVMRTRILRRFAKTPIRQVAFADLMEPVYRTEQVRDRETGEYRPVDRVVGYKRRDFPITRRIDPCYVNLTEHSPKR